MQYSSSSCLPAPSFQFFISLGWRTGKPSCQCCCPSEPKQTHQQWQRGSTLQSKKGLVSSDKEASQQGVCTWCPLRVQAPAAVCPELVFLSCICSVLKMVHDQSRRSELQSLPWVPKWPYCLCMHHVWGHFLREEERCIQIKYLQELPPYLSCE